MWEAFLISVVYFQFYFQGFGPGDCLGRAAKRGEGPGTQASALRLAKEYVKERGFWGGRGDCRVLLGRHRSFLSLLGVR